MLRYSETTLYTAYMIGQRMTANKNDLELSTPTAPQKIAGMNLQKLATLDEQASARLVGHLDGPSGAVQFHQRKQRGKVVVDVYLVD